jgi:hypothetical protein
MHINIHDYGQNFDNEHVRLKPKTLSFNDHTHDGLPFKSLYSNVKAVGVIVINAR